MCKAVIAKNIDTANNHVPALDQSLSAKAALKKRKLQVNVKYKLMRIASNSTLIEGRRRYIYACDKATGVAVIALEDEDIFKTCTLLH